MCRPGARSAARAGRRHAARTSTSRPVTAPAPRSGRGRSARRSPRRRPRAGWPPAASRPARAPAPRRSRAPGRCRGRGRRRRSRTARVARASISAPKPGPESVTTIVRPRTDTTTGGAPWRARLSSRLSMIRSSRRGSVNARTGSGASAITPARRATRLRDERVDVDPAQVGGDRAVLEPRDLEQVLDQRVQPRHPLAHHRPRPGPARAGSPPQPARSPACAGRGRRSRTNRCSCSIRSCSESAIRSIAAPSAATSSLPRAFTRAESDPRGHPLGRRRRHPQPPREPPGQRQRRAARRRRAPARPTSISVRRRSAIVAWSAANDVRT